MSRARLVPSPVLYICSTVYDELKILYDTDVSQSREIGFVKLYFRRNMEVYSSLGSAVGPSFALVDRNSDHQTSHLIMLYIHIGLSQVIFSLDLRFVVTRGMIIYTPELDWTTGLRAGAAENTRRWHTRECTPTPTDDINRVHSSTTCTSSAFRLPVPRYLLPIRTPHMWRINLPHITIDLSRLSHDRTQASTRSIAQQTTRQ